MIDSLTISNVNEIEELNEKAEKVEKPKDVSDIIKEYEQIICTKRKGIVAYYQGKVFSRFREKEKFVRLVADFGVHKNTIIFKINIFKLIDMHPKLMKSSATLSFLKNYLTDIKRICQENSNEFE